MLASVSGGRTQDNESRRYDVVVSYNRAEGRDVEVIARRLRDEGLRVFYDGWSMTAGRLWQEEILEAIQEAAACAVFIGRQGLGGWAREELAVAQSRAAKDPRFRLFMVLMEGAPSPVDPSLAFLGARSWVDLRADGGEGSPFERLMTAVTGGVPRHPQAGPSTDGAPCPYRGLEAFDERHAHLFFGRRDDTRRLCERLIGARFVAVLGPSGSGKTSIVKAGLLPALRGNAVAHSAEWTIRTMTPGESPRSALAAQLAHIAAEEPMQRTLDALAAGERTLDLAVALALTDRPSRDRFVLVVDQLEETFTLCSDEDERTAFLSNLTYAATIPGGRTIVVVALRADFYLHCARYPALRNLLAPQHVLIGPLGEEGLRRAIEEPAWAAGLTLEPGLVDTIVGDVGDRPGRLPLLQHVLVQIWQRRRGRLLTVEAYRESGGVQGALAKRADEIYDQLSESQRDVTERILLRLVQPGERTEDARRRVELDELLTAGDDAGVESVVRRLADERLLTTSRDETSGARLVEITHEALLQGWPRLRRWIERDREAPLPGVLRRTLNTPFVGRATELKSVRGAIRAVQSSLRQVVVFGGEPGVGKTRLVVESAREAHSHGFTVSWGVSTERLGTPYGTWIAALSHLVEHADEGVVARVVDRFGSELARVVPGLAPRVQPRVLARRSDPETERYMLFAGVVELLEALCAVGPVAVVHDDLQWADEPSLDLLRHVTRATGHLPLLLMLACRDSDLRVGAAAGNAVADIHEFGVKRISLGGFGVEDVTELMVGVAGHELGTDGMKLAAKVTSDSGGNPLFVGEILRHLRECGAIEQDANGRWHVRRSLASLPLPRGVRDVILRRVERLGKRPWAILATASVIGRAFDVEVLARVVDETEPELRSELASALDGSLLNESAETPGRLAFAHALIHDSLYGNLREMDRSRHHGRIAEALEQLASERACDVSAAKAVTKLADERPGDLLGDLVHHWESTQTRTGARRAARYAGFAGERALERLAPRDAVAWFARAHRLLSGGADDERLARCSILVGLGEAERQVGDASFRALLLEASATAELLGAADLMIRAVLANTVGPFGAPAPLDLARVNMLRRALVLAPDSPDAPLMMAILGKELYYGGEPAPGLAHAAEALVTARKLTDRRSLARVMAFTTSISPVAPLPDHRTLVAELASLADQLDDQELRFRAANADFIWAMHAGDREHLDHSVARMRKLASEVGQPIVKWTALWSESAQLSVAGDLAGAELRTMEADALARECGIPEGRLITFGQLLSLRLEQDRLEELLPLLDEQIARNPGLRLLRLTRGFIHAETGFPEWAAPVLEDAAADDFAFSFDRTRPFSLARCADIALRVGAGETAEHLYDLLLACRDQFATTAGVSSRGSIELSLGRIASMRGRYSTAEQHFERAYRAHERFDAPLLQARTLLARGESLLMQDTGDLARRSREILTSAEDIARKHGSVAIQRELRRVSALNDGAAASVASSEAGTSTA